MMAESRLREGAESGGYLCVHARHFLVAPTLPTTRAYAVDYQFVTQHEGCGQVNLIREDAAAARPWGAD